jgi:hypothetical protein
VNCHCRRELTAPSVPPMEGNTETEAQAAAGRAADARVRAYLAAVRRGDTVTAKRVAAGKREPPPRGDVTGS